MDGEAVADDKVEEIKPDRKSSEGFVEEDEESDEPILDKKQLLYKMLEK